MEIEEIRSIDDTDKVHDQHIIREPCNSVKVSSDPVLWVINNATIDHIMTNGFTKNMNRDFKKSKCEYATGPRYFLKADFETTLPNGENVYHDKEATKLFNIKFEEARARAEMEAKQKEKEKPLQPKNEGQRQKREQLVGLTQQNINKITIVNLARPYSC
uniref:Uncharacterized protein n=1 Tax=Trichogramma kaykai TaxID=54128 RepID=A0ABD2VRJ9_9HYME